MTIERNVMSDGSDLVAEIEAVEAKLAEAKASITRRFIGQERVVDLGLLRPPSRVEVVLRCDIPPLPKRKEGEAARHPYDLPAGHGVWVRRVLAGHKPGSS